MHSLFKMLQERRKAFEFLLSATLYLVVACSLTEDERPIQFPERPEPPQSPFHSPNNANPCRSREKVSSEEFLMKMNLCRKKVSVTCEIGGQAECHSAREVFRATAVVNKSVSECLIEANTTELKYIKFVVKAKYQKNLNQLGSRGLSWEPEPTVQRGRCTLGYTCINNEFLRDIRVNCFAFHYDRYENPFNGTSKKLNWDAPKNYSGPVIFRSMVQVSWSSFFFDVDTVKLIIPKD